ncbi:sigma-70 family RNA polymerase sigma factor [Kitasatospora sp. NPDC057223]|uniref:BACON domain-containing protein n=1 Tax=Kitasatospora sp. NPDC057223 TaxID=3346055 RepID=UPI003642AF1F
MTTSVERPRNTVLAAYDRQLDGLFTYCLSVLCEHEAAAAAVREVGELALRHGGRLAEPGLVRAWLYSLARYSCLHRLDRGPGTPPPADAAPADRAAAARRRQELASLAWPEAAGTDPEQREALELSVRHRLSPIEVAAVLGVPADTARALLASAGAEVGRTRAALLVLGVGSCPELHRLGGAGAGSWRGWVLGPALRRELVQHVVDCPTCRGTAERVAGEVGTGLTGLPGLPVLRAPEQARSAADRGAARPAGAGGPSRHGGAEGGPPGRSARSGPARSAPARSGPGGAGPGGAAFLAGAAAGRRAAARLGRPPADEPGLRFDQRGFPRHRAAGPGRAVAVRQRVLTTGVLAAVLAAPVITLWAGHQGGGGPGAAATVSSVRVDGDGGPRDGRHPDGPAAAPATATSTGEGAWPGPGQGAAGGLELAGAVPAETLFPRIQGPAVPVPALGASPIAGPALHSVPVPAPLPVAVPDAAPAAGAPAPAGLLTVEAAEYGSRTVITMTNSGGTDIHWHAVLDADWLRLSRDSGTLEPGRRITVTVTVDEERAPGTAWTARIALPPSQAVVTLEGGPQQRGGATPAPADPSVPATAPPASPAPSATASGTPSAPPSSSPAGTPPPDPAATPAPTATPGAPAPSSAPTAAPSASAPPTAPPGPAGGPQ